MKVMNMPGRKARRQMRAAMPAGKKVEPLPDGNALVQRSKKPRLMKKK